MSSFAPAMTIRRPVTVLVTNTLAATVTAIQITTGTETGPSGWRAKSTSDPCTRPDVLPSVYANRAPSSRTNMPNVAMNGGTSRRVTSHPLTSPTATAIAIAMRMPCAGPGPPSATSTAVNPITAATDRSTQRTSRTSTCPVTTTPRIPAMRPVLRMPSSAKKRGLTAAATTSSAIRMSNAP